MHVSRPTIRADEVQQILGFTGDGVTVAVIDSGLHACQVGSRCRKRVSGVPFILKLGRGWLVNLSLRKPFSWGFFTLLNRELGCRILRRRLTPLFSLL